MYIKSLEVTDFRCFGKAKMKLQYPGRKGKGASDIDNVNVILGDNGGGKSSVLRAIAIAVLGPVLSDSGFVPYRIVRRPNGKIAKIRGAGVAGDFEPFHRNATARDLAMKADFYTNLRSGNVDKLAPYNSVVRSRHGNGTTITTVSSVSTAGWDFFYGDNEPAYFIVGYGATRRYLSGDYSENGLRKSIGPRFGRVASLFEDSVPLKPLSSWLPFVPDANRQRDIIETINRCLPLEIRLAETRDLARFSSGVAGSDFEFGGVPTPIQALSDGYKTFIAWVADFVSHLHDVTPPGTKLTDIDGIVLVDEIDLHLHPEWQRKVVPQLAKAFPKIQFVFTSHSPLVASSVKKENIYVTGTDDQGLATIEQYSENVYGRSVEQLLLSSYFGLQTTRPPSFQAEADVLFKRVAAGDPDAAVEYLRKLNGTPEAAE